MTTNPDIAPDLDCAPDLHRAKRRKSEPMVRVDRLPPHSLEAERGVLGCVLLDPDKALAESIQLLHGKPDAFYDLRNQDIYRAMLEMFDRNIRVDVISLQQHLKDTQPKDAQGKPKDGNRLDMAGGIAYLSELPDAVPSAANLSYYANIVFEKFVLRQLLEICTRTAGRIYEFEGEVDSLMGEVQRQLMDAAGLMEHHLEKDAKELVRLAIGRIEEMHQNAGQTLGLSTGLVDLDKLTGGLTPAQYVIIAARPSCGKTSLAMQIADHVARVLKVPVGVFSLEMTDEELMTRMLCSEARVNLRTIGSGLGERDFPKLTGAAGKLSASFIHIDESPSLTILQVRAKARRMVQQYGVKLFVVDYLQLLSGGGRRYESRQAEVTEISKGLKALCKELRVPVLVLSQLNRDVEKRTSGRPLLSDLRESGAIEQDADMVGLLYRAKKSEDNDGDPDAVAMKLEIAKARNGPTGEIDLVFLKNFTRFESAARVESEDVPINRYPD